MAIQTLHFYWLPTRSAWGDAQAWQARRQAMTQAFLDNSDAINASFANAASNQIAGIAKLAATAALNRINAAAKAKFDQAAAVKLDPPASTDTTSDKVDTTA